RLKGQWAYLSLITDGYSKQIMGYALRTDLSAQGCLDALKMAFLHRRFPESELMHHSDRGSQYCSKEYVELLLSHKVAISMTENGDPWKTRLLNGSTEPSRTSSIVAFH